VLNATLLGLALSTHLLVVGLAGVVASEARNGATDGTLGTAGDTVAEIAELTLGLLLLALEVLLTTSGLERLIFMLISYCDVTGGYV
jgi:hypothetical protein